MVDLAPRKFENSWDRMGATYPELRLITLNP